MQARSCHFVSKPPATSYFTPDLKNKDPCLISLTSFPYILPLGPSAPATLASFLFPECKHASTSGPLHLLFLLFGTLFHHISIWLPPSLPLGLYSDVTFIVKLSLSTLYTILYFCSPPPDCLFPLLYLIFSP